MKDFSFNSEDGKKIYAALWPADSPKGIIQIIHGMAEHIARYDEFARFLNSRGFTVAGEDLRGHGKTAGTLENAGWLADSDGWQKMVKDNAVLGEKLRTENSGLPLYIISHSMGSFIARDLIAEYPEGISKVILSGTGSFESSQVLPLKIIASLQKLFTSSRKQAKLIDKLAFGGNNKQFEPGKTGFEWLSRDEEQVKLYVEDPFCGFVATAGFYLDFAEGLERISDSRAFNNTPADLPILLFSGDHDPVGGNGEGVKKVYERYLDTGHKMVEMKLNEGGHHESLNETNRTEVYNIFAGWLEDAGGIS